MFWSELHTEVARYAKKIYGSQLVQATQGNLSARDAGRWVVWVTLSGANYQGLTAEDVVVVNKDGNVVEGRWRPSLEMPVHTLILHHRHDIHCVMHTHSLYATALAVVYQPIPMILSESALCVGSEVPIVPYLMSGTPAFAETLGQGLVVL